MVKKLGLKYGTLLHLEYVHHKLYIQIYIELQKEFY